MSDLCYESLSHNKINPFGCNFQISEFAIDSILIYCSLSIFPVKNWSSITPLELNAPHAWALFE